MSRGGREGGKERRGDTWPHGAQKLAVGCRCNRRSPAPLFLVTSALEGCLQRSSLHAWGVHLAGTCIILISAKDV